MDERYDDPWRPFEAREHRRQLDALLERIERVSVPERRGLDLGCGDGRIAAPAAEAGVRVLAIDRDPAALAACPDDGNIVKRRADILDHDADFTLDGARASFGWCLGHTFMQFHDVRSAAGLMRRLRDAMAPGAWFAIDNFCDPLWADVAEGLWQTGLSEDGAWQFIWSEGDNTLALRSGEAVDPANWRIGPGDEVLRLWSRGELALLAEASGWRGPHRDDRRALLVFERA